MKDVLNRHKSAETMEGCSSTFYLEISKVIRLHKHALHFVDLVESTYASMQIFITGLTLATITLSEFEAAVNKTHQDIRFRFIIYGAGELIHILFHNYPGQRVQDHSLMIYQSCYDSEWYRKDVPNDCKKLINLMMIRSQKPCYLTGGGLFVLGLENYANILKASLSYFTFLSSVQ
uniref:Odorant receptor 73 n=1 Tax=Chouioia cunea TaxID=1570515 RepID=A0A6B9CS25_9HYME|nr:odorant receptor 73 [Chouioia cunea]